jgi:hypothetical protein
MTDVHGAEFALRLRNHARQVVECLLDGVVSHGLAPLVALYQEGRAAFQRKRPTVTSGSWICMQRHKAPVVAICSA